MIWFLLQRSSKSIPPIASKQPNPYFLVILPRAWTPATDFFLQQGQSSTLNNVNLNIVLWLTQIAKAKLHHVLLLGYLEWLRQQKLEDMISSELQKSGEQIESDEYYNIVLKYSLFSYS